MPEYRRFVAYFYEYIDGKRQRNAGFVKAEKRNGKWKLQIQIRAKGLPREQLPICVYTSDGGQYRKIQLGKTYPQGDMLSKVLLAEEGENRMPEILCGMWIGCDDRRCYISHWCEGTIQPEQLLEPENSKEEAAKSSEAEEAMDSEPKEIADSRTEIESNSGVAEPGDSDAVEIIKEINLQAEEAGEASGAELEKTGIEKEEKTEEAIQGLPRSTVKAAAHKNRERDWVKLQSRHGSCQPLEEEHIQAVMICPGDVLWLQSQGWPVGRSSFLMQGFCQHRHLLLAREDDGSFWLGVPGYENRRSQKEACAFGFPQFRRKRVMKSGMGPFGYWCRKIVE